MFRAQKPTKVLNLRFGVHFQNIYISEERLLKFIQPL